MDAAAVFRHGLGNMNNMNMMARNPPYHHHPPPPPPPHAYHHQQIRGPPPSRGDDHDGDGPSNRIAHTLTACCRCRQRKTRCDPTLPRCLPCERAGSVCEYFDTTKGKKINRNYVIKLQEKVRALEAELRQYTDEDDEFSHIDEDMVRPGGLVKLNDTDETPRYLGPSSGIAMTRLLVQGAKLFTDSKRISELIPEVRARRMTRMQSIVMTRDRKKSYPMVSAHPAAALPTRPVANKLVDVFCQRSQVFWPTLHEKQFLEDLEAVFAGDQDPYKNLIVRMVFAISLQKLDPQYAGLADSYYLAAMEHFEAVVCPKDLKSLQSLALIGQYSLLTPTRTAVYYMVGLAARICQAEGLTDEKTIAQGGYPLDPLTLDMRRRLAYIVTSMEAGLAHSMGRPNGFSKVDDRMDVEPFATVDDEYITSEGLVQGPPSENKLVALHFFKMRMEQAEIRRVLYEKKREEPRDENHPWFAKMEREIQGWIDSSPQNPAWCRPWFTGRYHQMRIFLYRPSPQVPRPSARAASICFEGASYIINLSKQQMEKAAVDITWVFLLNLYMSLNTLLWTISYPEIRQAHTREEVEELSDQTLDILEQCTERWPGTAQAVQLYSIFAKACLQSYEARDTPVLQSSSTFTTPPSMFDGDSPQGSENSASTAPSAAPMFKVNPPHNPPQFGFVFDATPESMNTFQWDNSFPPPQPTFRSNSIWGNPTADSMGRRFSAYPPDSPMPDDATPPATTTPGYTSSSPPSTIGNALPTPPESFGPMSQPIGTPTNSSSTISPPPMSTPGPMGTPGPMSTPGGMGTPGMHSSPLILQQGTPTMVQHSTNMSPPPPPHPGQRGPAFGMPPTSAPPQRPLPSYNPVNDWFNPPPPFINPDAFSSMSNSFFGDSLQVNGFNTQNPGLGLDHLGPGQPFNWSQERQGSLSQQQQMELMHVLENEGMSDIDALLNMGMNGTAGPTANWPQA